MYMSHIALNRSVEGIPLGDLLNLAQSSKLGCSSDSSSSKAKLELGGSDPCPCGSGKKLKKCCPRKLR